MRKHMSSFIILILSALIVPAMGMEPEEFDRLDGKGATQKRVDVIEWEGNLEIHVYPKGSLKGLGLKIDRTNKDKPVMVIAYRFNNVSYTLIRRAILSISLQDSFKVYEDTTADDYDKIMITNHTLTSNVKAFNLDQAPTQLYPDHHPMLKQGDEKGSTPATSAPATQPSAGNTRARPNVRLQEQQQRPSVDSDAPSFGNQKKRTQERSIEAEDGAIRSFSF